MMCACACACVEVCVRMCAYVCVCLRESLFTNLDLQRLGMQT